MAATVAPEAPAQLGGLASRAFLKLQSKNGQWVPSEHELMQTWRCAVLQVSFELVSAYPEAARRERQSVSHTTIVAVDL